MIPTRVHAAGLFSLALMLAPRVSSAEEGEFQLGLATPFLTYSNLTVETEFAGVSAETKTTEVEWGIQHSVVGELGYGVTPNIVVGGFVQLGGTSGSSEPEGGDEVDSSEFGLLLAPKFDYVFSPGDKIQPFVGAMLGLSMSSQSEEEAEASLTGFQVLGRFGIRAFPGNKEFSIDPSLMLGYVSASGDVEGGGLSADLSASGFQIGVFLGVSGWIG